MKKLTKKQKERREEIIKNVLIFVAVVGISFLAFGLLAIGADVGLEKGQEDGIQIGMDQAELNCVTLLCENAGCSNINHVMEVQEYCKSLVYGTDFYLTGGKQ